jgi:phenylpropionate dioxygenase-like ring-hydroxylating dioxygenase large terminal subunit
VHRDSKVALRKQLLDFIDSRTTDYADAPMWVEARRYVDAGYLRREHDLVFARHPRIAGHAAELAGPDDALTVTAGGITATVTRGAHGAVAAVDAAGVSYPACEYAGLIWLLPVAGTGLADTELADTGQAGTGLDMAAWLGPELDRDVQACGVAEAKLYRRVNFTLDMNWKAVMDGFTDAYHLQFVHPHTVGPFFHTNIYKCDPFGKNWRMVVARRGLENFRDEDFDYAEFAKYAIASFTVYPASIIALAPAHFEIWNIRPDPDDLLRCVVDLWFLVPELPATDKARAFREKNWEIVMHAVRDEDWVVARTVTDSLPFGGVDRLLLGRNEKATQVLHGQLAQDVPLT